MKMEEKMQEINMSFVQSAKKNKKGEMNQLIPSFGTNVKKSHDKTTKWVYLEPKKNFYVSPSNFFNAWILGGVGSIAASKA